MSVLAGQVSFRSCHIVQRTVGYGIEGNEKENQMKRVIAGGTAGVLMLAATGSLLAHHSLARFDTTTAVRVKGVIVLVAWVNPHSVLYVDEKRPDGPTQRWAAEGPGVLQLDRRAIGKDAFKVGDVIEVCGYTLKDEFDLPRTTSIEPSSSSPKDTTSASLSGRVPGRRGPGDARRKEALLGRLRAPQVPRAGRRGHPPDLFRTPVGMTT